MFWIVVGAVIGESRSETTTISDVYPKSKNGKREDR
jgi:hypothetical protein